MRLIRFRLQGFKNIADISVNDLSDINVFFGLNDVGKSNVFEALRLWRRFLAVAQAPRWMQSIEDFARDFGTHLFSLGGPNEFSLDVDLAIDSADLPRERLDQHIVSMLDGCMRHLGKKTIQLTSQIKSALQSNGVVMTSEAHWEDGTQISLHPQELASIVPPVHVIAAERRFQVEERNRETFSGSINHRNLKRALSTRT